MERFKSQVKGPDVDAVGGCADLCEFFRPTVSRGIHKHVRIQGYPALMIMKLVFYLDQAASSLPRLFLKKVIKCRNY